MSTVGCDKFRAQYHIVHYNSLRTARCSDLFPKHNLRIATAEGANSQSQVITVLKHSPVTTRADILRNLVLTTINYRLEILHSRHGASVVGVPVLECTVLLTNNRDSFLSLWRHFLVSDIHVVLVLMFSPPSHVEECTWVKENQCPFEIRL